MPVREVAPERTEQREAHGLREGDVAEEGRMEVEVSLQGSKSGGQELIVAAVERRRGVDHEQGLGLQSLGLFLLELLLGGVESPLFLLLLRTALRRRAWERRQTRLGGLVIDEGLARHLEIEGRKKEEGKTDGNQPKQRRTRDEREEDPRERRAERASERTKGRGQERKEGWRKGSTEKRRKERRRKRRPRTESEFRCFFPRRKKRTSPASFCSRDRLRSLPQGSSRMEK